MDHHGNGRKKSSQCEVGVLKLACSGCDYIRVVAQRLEHQAISQKVAGSIPANSNFSQFLNKQLKTDF